MKSPPLKISLIICTLGRRDELARLLDSLVAQDYPHCELIVVDQNIDGLIDSLIAQYGTILPTRHLRSPPGLSRARNVGLRVAEGDVLAFPDDDCWYPAGLLNYVASQLRAKPELDGITGRFVNENGQSEGRWLRTSQRLTVFNVWRGAISFTIFLRAHTVQATGVFNEQLGLGAGTSWGAGEETEFLLRAIEREFRIDYDYDLLVHHPLKCVRFDRDAVQRQRKYQAGFGRVIRHGPYPFWYFPLTCLRTLSGAVLAAACLHFGEARCKLNGLSARIHGWTSAPSRDTPEPTKLDGSRSSGR